MNQELILIFFFVYKKNFKIFKFTMNFSCTIFNILLISCLYELFVKIFIFQFL